MEGGEQKQQYPFKTQPGEQIAKGWSESRVFKQEPGWVIKVTYRGKRNTLEQLTENKSDYEFFKSRLGDNVPETQFVRGTEESGKEVNIVRQREIVGKTLKNYPKERLEKNPEAQKNLMELFKKILKMWDEDGRIPDVVGHLFSTHPKQTSNIIIENGTNKAYLVDTSASKRFQSKNAPFIYRKLSENIIKNMRGYVGKYESKI